MSGHATETPFYFQIDAGTLEARALTFELDQTTGRLTYLNSGDTRETTARRVTTQDALSYPPLFSGIGLISGDISGMPLNTKLRTPDGIVDAIGHSTRELLLRRTGVNEFTANLFIEALIGRALFYGIGGARIYRGGPLHRPVRLELIRNAIRPVDRIYSGRKYRFYEYTDEMGTFQQVMPEDMLILNGPSLDAFHGMGIYDYSRAVVGRALAAATYSDEFFTGGAVPQGWFSHPGEMSEAAQERFWEGIRKRHAQRMPFGIIEEGMSWVPSGISPNDAQVVSLLEWSAADVSRLLRIPASKLGVTAGTGAAPAKSVEQEQKSYLASCLMFWMGRLESECNDKLFREDEKDAFYTCFDYSKFLAMTTTKKEQAEADKIDIYSAIKTPDEVRASRNMNPHPDGIGSMPLWPLNVTTNPANLSAAGQLEPGKETEADEHTEPDEDDRTSKPAPQAIDPAPEPPRVSSLHRDVLLDALERMAKRLGHAAARAATRPERYLDALDGLDAAHRSVMIQALSPGMALIASVTKHDTAAIVGETVDDLLSRSHAAFLAAADGPPDTISSRIDAASATLCATVSQIADRICEVNP